MKSRRVLLAALTIVMFTFPPAFPAFSEENGAALAGRGDYIQTGTNETVLNPVSNGYSNDSFKILIPANATIYSATVDLEGKPVVIGQPAITADFASGETNYKAYKGTYTSSSPGSAKPMTFAGQEFAPYEVTQIASSDGTYASQWGYYYNNEYAYHQFAFKVPMDISNKVTVHWEGFGGYYYYGTGACAVYLWNNGTGGGGSWEQVGTGSGTSVQTIEKSFSDVNANYLDQTHTLHVLALGTGGQYYYNIQTDYVKVNIEGSVLVYPKNPTMDIGSTKGVWTLPEEKFNYLVNVAELGLMPAIQNAVKNGVTEKVEVKIKFNSASTGKIKISNFKVNYNSPPWCTGIPSTFKLDEDTPVLKLIDLNSYFTDDRVPRTLTYEVTYQQDSKKLAAEKDKDDHSLDFKLPSKNWYGALGFRVKATDTDGLSRESNTFTVKVDPVNDPPVLVPVGRQVATQRIPFNLTVKARDVDMDLDPTEEITFADNSSLFDIDPLTGLISFTPAQDQVGMYNIMITVTDRAGESDTENFTLEVMDAPDPPVLDPIPEQTATQDIPFSFTVAATDPDLPYGDALTFLDDSPLFKIDPATGEMLFSPTVKDIGVHKVTITVKDKAALTDSEQFNLNILNSIGNMDRPPSIEAIPNQTAQEGVPFELTIKATDPDIDLGDEITFSDNSAAFDINANSGKISFTPLARDAGTSKVRITVKDRDGLTATSDFWLTVLKTNHAPVVTSILPKDGTKVNKDKRFILSAAAYDPDGDRLNYTWKDGENLLGNGANLTLSFGDTGTYIITLIVTDGKLEQVNETSIEVADSSGGGGGGGSTPGFGTALAAAAIVSAILGLAGRRKRPSP